jgi:hypothetical protein
LLALDTAAEDPNPGSLGFSNHGVCSLAYRGYVFIGNMIHGAVIKRNQVPGHRYSY